MTKAQDEYEARRELEKRRLAVKKRRPTAGPGVIHHARKQKVAGRACRACGATPGVWIEAHHIVHRSRLAAAHPQLHHGDNLMPLCRQCHTDHHTTAHRRVPRSVLTDAEIRFVIEHASEAWLEQWYPRPIQTGGSTT